MTDLAFKIDETGSDLELELGDLRTEGGLVSAVLVSLFSDGRARDDDDIPDGSDDPRGWWAADSGDRFGSLLWLYDRGKTLAATAADVREAAQDALRWLEAQEIASEVTVGSSVNGRHEIDLDVVIRRGSSRVWASLWEALETTEFDLPGVSVKLLTY